MAEIIDIHKEQEKRETIPMTLKRLYRIINNNIESINREAARQRALYADIANTLNELDID